MAQRFPATTSMSGPKTPPLQPPPPAGGSPRIHRHGVDGLSARSKDQQRGFAHDIEWKVVGPMPTRTFLDEFLPKHLDLEVEFNQNRFDPNEIKFASVPDSPAKEEDMYAGLVSMELSISYPSNRTNPSVTI